MCRRLWWGAAASVILGLACGVARAERDTYLSAKAAADSGPKWWWPWGGSKKKETPKKSTAKAEKKDKPADPAKPAPRPPSAAEEQASFLRRQQVCIKLRQVAHETDDPGLATQAEVMEQKAWLLYEQRVLGSRAKGTLAPEAANGRADEAEPAYRPDDRPVHHIAARDADKEDSQ